MDKDTMIKLYGTDDADKIIRDKSTGRQDRVFSSGVEKTAMPADEVKRLCKKAKIEYLDGYEERVFKYRFTDSTVDWYGDIVDAKGANLKVFQKQHPVILAFHNYKALPVGACLDVWYDKDANAIDGYVLFYDDRVDRTEFSDTIYRFVSSGGMRACSIGFAPEEEGGVYRPTDEERKSWKMGKYGVKFLKWTLLELSVCPVPANPSAGRKSFDTLAQARSANIIDDARLEQIAKAIDEEVGKVVFHLVDDVQKDLPVDDVPTADDVVPPDVSAQDNGAAVADEVKEFAITVEDSGLSEVKDLLNESINYVKILTNKVADLQEQVERMESKSGANDPALRGEPKAQDDDIYATVLSGSLDFIRSIKKL